ncbi:hypothetical protein Glove_396g20 [Diversispora epigaea]|uniref:Uncharacterized protein n=1 Tax=Diversispora epigaea TaxID=1348612 RepID=A0A397H1J8_9GLOM|nr:hypothetical protein Glove_396g20 [Diversispora epigaea]
MDISSERHKTDDVIAKTEEMITDIRELNLTILVVITDSAPFKTTFSYALKIAAYFKNANNKYFIGQLRTIQKEIYGKYIQPMIPGDTRWNSYLTCCSNIKATKNVLRGLEPCPNKSSGYPNDLKIEYPDEPG